MRLTRRAACLATPALVVRPARSGTEAITLLSDAAPGSLAALWVQGFAPLLERHWPFSSVRVATSPGGRGLLAARRLAGAPRGTCGAITTPQLLCHMVEAGATDLLDELTLVAAVVEEALVLLAPRGDAGDLTFRRPGAAAMTLGIPPPGSAAALAARWLAECGAAIQPIGFATPAAARKAVETGSVPLALLALPDAIASLRDGRLAAIGVAGTQRLALVPETPTMAELGYPVTLVGRRGLVLPRVAPAEHRSQLGAALSAIVTDAEFIAQSYEQGYLPQLVPGPDWLAECHRLLQRMAVPLR